MWWKLILGYVIVLAAAPSIFLTNIAVGTIGAALIVSALLENQERRRTAVKRPDPFPQVGARQD